MTKKVRELYINAVINDTNGHERNVPQSLPIPRKPCPR